MEYTLENKKILVTGGGGFVGTNVIKALIKQNAKIYGTIHNKQPRNSFSEVTYIRADLTKKEEALNATKGMDCVVLTAAYVTGAEGMLENPMCLVTDTVILNLTVLEAAYLNGVRKVIYISSGMVYPFLETPLREEDGFIGDPYEKYFTGGWTRRFIEVVCRMYAEKLGAMDITALRIDNLYGPYDNFERAHSHVIASLIRKAVERMDPFEVWGNGKDYKDFSYIEDLAEGVVLALKKSKGFQVYNLASGVNYTINDILEVILRSTKYEDAQIVYNNTKPSMIPYKVMCIDKARQELGYKPMTSIEDGIRKTIQWYKNNPALDQ